MATLLDNIANDNKHVFGITGVTDTGRSVFRKLLRVPDLCTSSFHLVCICTEKLLRANVTKKTQYYAPFRRVNIQHSTTHET
jgi:hypothetical protein